MIVCVLCGKPMVAVAPGVLLHLEDLVSLLAVAPPLHRSTFQPLLAAS